MGIPHSRTLKRRKKMSMVGEILIYVLLIIGLVALLIRELAKMDVCFTFRETNGFKFVDSGEGNYHKTISPNKGSSLVERMLGVVYYGLWPFRSIHKFEIEKQWENLAGTGPENWIKVGKKEFMTSLREFFPRPFIFTDIELSDRLTVSIKLVVKFQAVDPVTPVYIFRGDFFTQAGSILQGEVIDALRIRSIDDFIKAPKGEVAGILSDFKNPIGLLNQEMLNQVGLRIVGVSINDYKPGDEDIVKAIRKTAIAEQEGNANIMVAEKAKLSALIDANKQAEVLLTITTAEVSSQNQLSEARANRVRATVASLAVPGSDPTLVAQSAANVLEMEAATVKDSKITTLFQRGSTQPSAAVPINKEDKK